MAVRGSRAPGDLDNGLEIQDKKVRIVIYQAFMVGKKLWYMDWCLRDWFKISCADKCNTLDLSKNSICARGKDEVCDFVEKTICKAGKANK